MGNKAGIGFFPVGALACADFIAGRRLGRLGDIDTIHPRGIETENLGLQGRR